MKYDVDASLLPFSCVLFTRHALPSNGNTAKGELESPAETYPNFRCVLQSKVGLGLVSGTMCINRQDMHREHTSISNITASARRFRCDVGVSSSQTLGVSRAATFCIQRSRLISM